MTSLAFADPTNKQGLQITGLRATKMLCNLLFMASTDLCLTPWMAPGIYEQHIYGCSSLHRILTGSKHIPVRANMRPGVKTTPCHSDTKPCGCLSRVGPGDPDTQI